MPPKRKTRSSSSSKPTTEFGIDYLSKPSLGGCDNNQRSLKDEHHFEMEDIDSDASTEPDTTVTPKRGKKTLAGNVKQFEIVEPKKNLKIRVDKRLLFVDGFRYNLINKRDDRGLQWFRCASYARVPVDGQRCSVKAAILNGKLVSLDSGHTHAPHDSPMRRPKFLTNHTVEWIDSCKTRYKVLLVSGYRFYRATSLNKGDGLMWYGCANRVKQKNKCSVKAAMLEGNLVSLKGTHNHLPHVTTKQIPRGSHHREAEISDAGESEPVDTNHRQSPVKRTTLGQVSKCLNEVSHFPQEPKTVQNDQNMCEATCNENLILDKLSHDGQIFASNLNMLTTESQNLDSVKSKPLPMSIRVQVLEKDLSVKEVIIKTLAEELCCANEIKKQNDERILRLETELAKTKENNGKLVEKINRIMVESMSSIYM
ncbi:hypothetical protein HDE_07920 [Halotydeus destructor]|nr:hypothetical protein HDE_07920 [Halotydeus destructor]